MVGITFGKLLSSPAALPTYTRFVGVVFFPLKTFHTYTDDSGHTCLSEKRKEISSSLFETIKM